MSARESRVEKYTPDAESNGVAESHSLFLIADLRVYTCEFYLLINSTYSLFVEVLLLKIGLNGERNFGNQTRNLLRARRVFLAKRIGVRKRSI